MATATAEHVHVPILKGITVDNFVPYNVLNGTTTINLSPEEVVTLRALFRCVRGLPDKSLRKHIQAIETALDYPLPGSALTFIPDISNEYTCGEVVFTPIE
jgi:hypothetical protein